MRLSTGQYWSVRTTPGSRSVNGLSRSGGTGIVWNGTPRRASDSDAAIRGKVAKSPRGPAPPPVYQGQFDPRALFGALKVFLCQ